MDIRSYAWKRTYILSGRMSFFFQSAILDGVDLDIEDHKFGGYAQLVKKLRELEKGAGTRKYLITGAPQCPYPDASLGPKTDTALGDQGSQFDHVYVQFYNNYCHTGDPAQFDPNVKQWLQFAAGAKQAHDWLMVLKKSYWGRSKDIRGNASGYRRCGRSKVLQKTRGSQKNI